MATLQEAINLARSAINDTDPVRYRYSTDDLLQYANDALDAMVVVRPELFYCNARITCVGGSVQRFNAVDSVGLRDIFYREAGGVVTRTDRDILNNTKPNWMTDSAGAAVHWMPILDDPNGFFIYPPAEAGQALIGMYVKVPEEYALDAAIPLPSAYIPIIADYVIAMAQSSDAEHVISGRVQLFMTKFYQALGVAEQSSMGNRSE